MASEADITELELEVETRATNDLTPPSKTDGFKQETFPSYSNASIPMPGEWSQYPARLYWTLQVYAYKIDEKSKACFIMVHSGSVQSIISQVRLTHKITSVDNGASGAFVNHFPRTNDGQRDGQSYKYDKLSGHVGAHLPRSQAEIAPVLCTTRLRSSLTQGASPAQLTPRIPIAK